MKRGYSILLLCFTLLISLSAAKGQNTFKVEAPNIVGSGERFLVKFISDGDVTNFVRPTITGADVIAGPSTSTSSYTSWVNGKRTDSYTVTYTYVLEADQQGQINITPATATIGGSTYSTRSITIDIVKGASSQGSGSQSSQGGSQYGSQGGQQSGGNQNGNQDPFSSMDEDDPGITYGKADLFLRLSFNKTKVVKGEPIIATLKLYTRSNIVGLEDVKMPVFNGFWSQEIEVPQNINFTREKVGNQIYSSALIRRYMIMPQQSGALTVDPCEMVCQVQVVTRKARSRSIFDDFFDNDTYDVVKKKLSTGKHVIHVSELPGGAPESFGGGVGKLSMTARLTKDSLKSNEAASLIVELSGSGNLNLIEAPKVELPQDFEKYDAKSTNNFSNTAEGAVGKKVYEYPFIPRADGTYTIPSIEYSYFDLNQRRYVTLHTEPIEVKVAKGSANPNGATFIPASQKSVGNLGDDIRYIKTAMPSFKKAGRFTVLSWPFYLIAALLIAGFFGIKKLTSSRIALAKDVMRTRNRKANKVARTRLKKAQNYLSQNKVQEFYEELHKALLGYTSDKLSIQRSELQRDVIEETLLGRNVPTEQVASLISLLDDCEMVRYSPEGAAGAMDAQYKKAVGLISDLENKL
ncbi:MAG: protein BatD [Bacteroidales bacterium]|nr:protein BatD [Bacteroidales bacterium]